MRSKGEVGGRGPYRRTVTGETDLDRMLATLTVTRRPGRFTMVTLPATVPPPSIGADGVEAIMVEDEGTTVVATVERAEADGWPVGFVGAWLTLDVHSSLEAVGLTAAVAGALAAEGIAANMVAAYHHDHLLVPVDAADRAAAILSSSWGN